MARRTRGSGSRAGSVWRERLATSGWALVPGLYAWAASVALPALEDGASLQARGFALGAPLALLISPWALGWAGSLGASVCLFGFLGACSVSWALLAEQLSVAASVLSPQALATLAWGVFVVGWGRFVHRVGAASAWATGPSGAPASRSPAEILRPRGRVSPLRIVGFVTASLVAASLVLIPWLAQAPEALLAHACGLVGAVALVSVAARCLFLPQARAGGSWLVPLGLLCVWAAVGAILWRARGAW